MTTHGLLHDTTDAGLAITDEFLPGQGELIAPAGRAERRSATAPPQRVDRREPSPRGIGSEELAHLRFLRAIARVAAAQPPDELAQGEVARRHLVESSLPVKPQALHGPGADAGQRSQASPRTLVVGARAGRRARSRPRAPLCAA